MKNNRKKIDIVTFSLPLKNKLRKRLFNELNLSYSKVVQTAKEDGIDGINRANLSRYFGSDRAVSGSISQKSLLYLAYRYGVIVRLKVMSKPYNESECKSIVEKMFNG